MATVATKRVKKEEAGDNDAAAEGSKVTAPKAKGLNWAGTAASLANDQHF